MSNAANPADGGPTIYSVPRAQSTPERLANAADAATAAATAATAASGNMLLGLRGLWLQIAQLGALGVVLVVFYQDRHAALDQAKEDRLMFRQEIAAQRERDSREQQAMQRVISENTAALRELVSEMKIRRGHPEPEDDPRSDDVTALVLWLIGLWGK